MTLHRRGFAYLLVLLLPACSSDSKEPTTPNGPDGQQDISNVIYAGGATDEALVRMLDITPKNDPRYAAIVDSPDLTAPVPKDSPVTFSFHLASSMTQAPALNHEPKARPGSKWRRPIHELLQLLAPERIAHAHGNPFNGTAYYLVISDKDGKQILQVFTSATSFTPEALDFQHLSEAPQPLTLAITSASFDDNSVPADGGPFVGGTFSFRIE